MPSIVMLYGLFRARISSSIIMLLSLACCCFLSIGLSAQANFSELLALHPQYKEFHLSNKLFKHTDIQYLVDKYAILPGVKSQLIGHSFEGRSIHILEIGSGKRNVMLWTQMHGDEPTATMAVFDILQFLTKSDSFDAYRNKILSELTIYVIPMLNPDGAEIFKRRNAQDIDLNRDALDKKSLEATLLWKMADSIKPVFGFNLHDQSPYYTVGESGKQTRIAFLAPAYMSFKDSLNDNRANAMRLIAKLDKSLQEVIPGEVARFNDTYEPRAFGDQFQASGMSTVLIESGGNLTDSSKQYNRSLHFALLLEGFNQIASKGYLYEGLQAYFDIPSNRRNAFDVILRNVSIDKSNKGHLAFNNTEFYTYDYLHAYSIPIAVDMGELEGKMGFEERDMNGVPWIAGKVLTKPLSEKRTIKQLIKAGFTAIQVNSEKELLEWSNVPFTLHYFPLGLKKGRVNRPLDFFFQENGINYIFLNGQFHKLDEFLMLHGDKKLTDFQTP
jgi:hypothetical protein